MLFNILKHYLRGVSRRKLFSFINITGLGFALAFLILIGQFIYHEFNCNRDLKNAGNIYRIVDAKKKNYNMDYRMKDQIPARVPGIKNICMVLHGSMDANIGNNFFSIKNAVQADSGFFDFFNLSFLSGDPRQALTSPDYVVLTETTAMKIFGSIDAVGKSLRLDHRNDMIVSGVVRDLPENTGLDADLFIKSASSDNPKFSCRMELFTTDGIHITKSKIFYSYFIEVGKNADIPSIERQISALHKIDDFLYPEQVILTPLVSNYFNTEFKDKDLKHGNADLIKLLVVIGAIILLLAVINFVNLTTAGYTYRMTEIGVKKCLGADRRVLMKQLLSESLFTCAISSFLGIFSAWLLLPYFNRFVNKPMTMQLFTDFNFLLIFVLFVVILGIVIGIFPSLFLSRISPLQLFRFTPNMKTSGKGLRNILTMLQFSVTIIMIFGLIVISNQIDYVKHKDLGFSTDKLAYLKIPYTMDDRIDVIYNKLKDYHGIKSITKTNGIPGAMNMLVGWKSPNFDRCTLMIIDSATLKTFGFRIVEGENMPPAPPKPPKGEEVGLLWGHKSGWCLVNETALRELGGGDFNKYTVDGSKIAGVVSDFTFDSFINRMGPLIMEYNNGLTPNDITLRINGPTRDAVEYIHKIWKEVFPDYPEELNYYDESFASMYKKEEDLAVLVNIFSILAVVISCMGIFGLSVYQSEQKIKEIGVRKVLGASVSEIVLLLTGSFSKWVLFANIIAWPVSYYLMHRWLQDFAYRIEITWWIFFLSGSIALLIALFTIIFQAIKAATANLTESLRYE